MGKVRAFQCVAKRSRTKKRGINGKETGKKRVGETYWGSAAFRNGDVGHRIKRGLSCLR